MLTPIRLTLPEPPSANRWWRHVGSRVLVSQEARFYKQRVASMFRTSPVVKIAAPRQVRIEVVWYRGRKSGDLDKRLGVLLDALQAIAYDNDSQIVEIAARRVDEPRVPKGQVQMPARVTVELSEVIG